MAYFEQAAMGHGDGAHGTTEGNTKTQPVTARRSRGGPMAARSDSYSRQRMGRPCLHTQAQRDYRSSFVPVGYGAQIWAVRAWGGAEALVDAAFRTSLGFSLHRHVNKRGAPAVGQDADQDLSMTFHRLCRLLPPTLVQGDCANQVNHTVSCWRWFNQVNHRYCKLLPLVPQRIRTDPDGPRTSVTDYQT